jgi:hypothetical protein
MKDFLKHNVEYQIFERLYLISQCVIIIGAVACFLPVFQMQSDAATFSENEAPLLPAFDRTNVENVTMRDLAMLSFAVTIPSMVDTISEVVYTILCWLRVITNSSPQPKQIVGLSTSERLLFLLGVEIGSLYVSLHPSYFSSDTPTVYYYYYKSVVLSISMKCSLMLCSCSLILCLYRMLPRSGRCAWSSPLTTTFMIISMVAGCIILSNASPQYTVGKGFDREINMGYRESLRIAGILLVLSSLCVFTLSVFTWLWGKFQTRRPARKRDGDVPLFDVQTLVPGLLMLTVCLAAWTDASIMISVVRHKINEPENLVGSSEFIELACFFGSLMLAALLIIILEKRMKSLEIARGLVSTSSLLCIMPL